MNAPQPSPVRCRSIKGFTLLEMMITLAIFVLLCAAIFGIVSGVLKGSAGLVDNQNRQDQVVALNAYLKNKLADLPAQSFLLSYRRGTGDGLKLNGIVFGGNGGSIAIDATPQPNGLYLLRRGILPMTGSMPAGGGAAVVLPPGLLQDEDATLDWVPLIHDVKSIEWKFQQPTSTLWEEQWSNTANKPNIVEFTIQLAGDLQPTTMDFWIPPIAPVTLTVPTQTGTQTPTSGYQQTPNGTLTPAHGP